MLDILSYPVRRPLVNIICILFLEQFYATTGKSFGDWQELFGDPVIATAILDRLLHHCRIVNIQGHSYRLRNHAQALIMPEQKGGTA
jgi:DNA replication protein DnaC